MVLRFGIVIQLSVFLLLSCGGQRRSGDRVEILAEGNGVTITKAGFDDYVKTVPPFTRAQMSDDQLLDRYIRIELLYVEALNQGLDRDPEVREKMDTLVKQLLVREYFQTELDEKMGIDDESVAEYYEQHKEEFVTPDHKKCWHILTKTKEDAEDAKQHVLNGEDFSDVARRVSIDDQTRENKGRIGIFSREDAPDFLKERPVLLDTLFSLGSGNMSEVVETDLGFHILRSTTARSAPYQPLDRVSKEIREKIIVPDSLVEQYYEDHQESYSTEDKARVRHILVSSRVEANTLRERILQGEDMAALAKEVSTHKGSKRSGGLIGWVRRETTIRGVDKSEKLKEAIFDAKENELGPIVESGDGFHVFRVEKREYVGVRPLDEVKDGIAAQLLVGERKGAIDRAFEMLKEKYEIRLRKAGAKSSFKTMVETPHKKVDVKTRESMGEEELFSLAQEESDPSTRLDVYREIVTRFPEGERADESQFMIGFVLSEELGDSSGGRKAYEELTKRYPDSDWVDDARAMLRIVGGTQSDVGPDEG